MAQSHKTKLINDTNGNEIIMIRVDKALSEFMSERPSSRWDADYWHPKFERLALMASNVRRLGDFIPDGPIGITYGAIITGRKNKDVPDGVPIIGGEQVTPTGLDLANCERTERDSAWDPPRSRVYYGNLVLVRSGVGSLGKSSVYLSNEYANVGCFVDRITLDSISPFYVDIFLKTEYGQLQIERFNAGVSGTTNISFDQIKAIRIPLISQENQKQVEREYLKMSKCHNTAVKAKSAGDMKVYRREVTKAERILSDLIKRVEAVIRGERKDIF